MAKETSPDQTQRGTREERRAELAPDDEGWLRCRACELAIARAQARIEAGGRHVHTFVNPGGLEYTIACFAEAPGCTGAGEEETFWTWFPGHAWRVALCGGCATQLGWSFHGRAATFWGLIVDRLI
jgi:hypothetical protein